VPGHPAKLPAGGTPAPPGLAGSRLKTLEDEVVAMVLQFFASVLVNFDFILKARNDKFGVLLKVFKLVH
jgi:hypothetical protein